MKACTTTSYRGCFCMQHMSEADGAGLHICVPTLYLYTCSFIMHYRKSALVELQLEFKKLCIAIRNWELFIYYCPAYMYVTTASQQAMVYTATATYR